MRFIGKKKKLLAALLKRVAGVRMYGSEVSTSNM